MAATALRWPLPLRPSATPRTPAPSSPDAWICWSRASRSCPKVRPPARSRTPRAARTLNRMVSPQDLFELPEYIELAKKLGIELKDLIDAKNSTAITVVNRTQHALVFIEELRTAPGDWADG